MVTLEEYVSRMKEGQKYIYYACGETTDRIDRLPQTELLKDKGYEILYLTDDVDEFALRMMMKFDDHEFKNVADKDLGLETEEETSESKKLNEDNGELLRYMKDALGEKVTAVRLSERLKSHPVCLSADGGMSLEMEKVLNAMPGGMPDGQTSTGTACAGNQPRSSDFCPVCKSCLPRIRNRLRSMPACCTIRRC